MLIQSSGISQKEVPVERQELHSGGARPKLPSDISGSQEDVFELCAFAAGLSGLVYAPVEVSAWRKQGFVKFDFKQLVENECASRFQSFGSHSQQAYAFVLDRRAWLGIRGTDEGSDWLLNLSFLRGRHFGFRSAWREGLQSAVMNWLHANHDAYDSLVITGHSLGGALATLAADHISTSNQSKTSPQPPKICIEAVITFASPRVGSPQFARRYRDHKLIGSGSTLGKCTYRFANDGDIVPKVPPAVFGFKHVVEEIDTRQIGAVEKTISRTVNWNLSSQIGQAYVPSDPLDPLLTSPRPTTVREAFVDAQGVFSKSIMQVPFAYLILSGFWATDRGAMHMMTLYGNAFGRYRGFAAVEPPRDMRPWSLTSKVILGSLLLAVLALVLIVIYFTLVWSGWFLFWCLMALLAFTLYYYLARNREPKSVSSTLFGSAAPSSSSATSASGLPIHTLDPELMDELRQRLAADGEKPPEEGGSSSGIPSQ